MTYDQFGNVIDDAPLYGYALHGLAGENDPTIGTAAAEIIGSFPNYLAFEPSYVSWTNPFGATPGVMQQEQQTISPYIIAAGKNQPQVTGFDALRVGVDDAAIAANNAAQEISANAAKLGEALFTGGKWLVVALVAAAVLETVRGAERFAPHRNRRGRK